MKILILDCTGEDWTDRKLREQLKVDVASIYRQVTLPMRALRRFWVNFLPYENIWYGHWKYNLKQYNVIIVFSALLSPRIFSWIRKQGYTGRLILYYRDPQSAVYLKKNCCSDYIRNYESSVEMWTFDDHDSIKYRMNYNPQFYFYSDYINDEKYADRIFVYDAIYVGASHGRENDIRNIYSLLCKKGMNIRFKIRGKIVGLESDDKLNYIRDNIPYDEVLKLNLESKSIIEINQYNQVGLTVRSLEALFFKRKLITNNILIKKMDFYNTNNIFIFGIDNLDNIDAFLSTPFEEIPDNIVKKYSCQEWLHRFLESKDRWKLYNHL